MARGTDLNRDDRRVLDLAVIVECASSNQSPDQRRRRQNKRRGNAQVDALGPIRVQRLLDDLSRKCLGAVARDDRKGIGKAVGRMRWSAGKRGRSGVIRRSGADGR